MGPRSISLPAVALAGAGGVAVYAAVRGVGAASGFRYLLSGRAVPAGEDLTVTDAGPADAAGGEQAVASGVGSPIADAAMAYDRKARYRWGGGNPTRGWDCSGFVNWVLCHDLGLAIPGYAGGTFTGAAHGPTTTQWALWSGTQKVSRDQVLPGDIILWPTQHMGIAINDTHMINAPGPNGTPAPIVSSIDHHPDLFGQTCRRLLGRR